MNHLAEQFATRLRNARHAQGMSLDDIAAHAGVSKTTVYKLEIGLGRPSRTTYPRLVALLGKSIDVFDLQSLPHDRRAKAHKNPPPKGATGSSSASAVPAPLGQTASTLATSPRGAPCSSPACSSASERPMEPRAKFSMDSRLKLAIRLDHVADALLKGEAPPQQLDSLDRHLVAAACTAAAGRFRSNSVTMKTGQGVESILSKLLSASVGEARP